MNGFASGADSPREKTDSGGELGFGVQFDPPVEVLFHHCDDSNNSGLTGASYAKDRKGGSRVSVGLLSTLPTLLPRTRFLSRFSAFAPSVYLSVYIYSSIRMVLPLLLLDSRVPCTRSRVHSITLLRGNHFPHPFPFFAYTVLCLDLCSEQTLTSYTRKLLCRC